MVEFAIEYSPSGNQFRIWACDGTVKVGGEWAGYRSIARLDFDGKQYIAVSTFFGGTVPAETVMEIVAVKGSTHIIAGGRE